ncbi:unnamed protein product, partial [marine sediment metagenome]
FSTPKVHIRDFFARCELDENYEHAILKVKVKIYNFGKEDVKQSRVEISLLDDEQQLVESEILMSEAFTIKSNTEHLMELQANIESPRKWT